MDQRWPSQNSTTTPRQVYAEDLPMEDADLDPYNKQKYEDVRREYSSELSAQQQPHSRSAPMFPPGDESPAARQYSPMKLSPTPQDTASSQYMSYTPTMQPSRASPSRPGMLSSNSYSYYPTSSMWISSAQTHVFLAHASYCRFTIATVATVPITTSPES